MRENELRKKVADNIQKQYRDYLDSLQELPASEVIIKAEQIVCLDYLANYFDPVLQNDIEIIRWADEHPMDALPLMYAIWLKLDRSLSEVLEDAVIGRLKSCLDSKQ